MHVPLLPMSPRQLCLHPTARWASNACCPRVAHPIQDAQTCGYDDGACINGQNGDLGRDIPVLFCQCQLLAWGMGTYSGASLAWKVSGPMMLAMLKAAATRELPAT